jgi:hypothetical protein
LLDLQKKHDALHLQAYGCSHIKPKHHFSKHFADQYLRDRMVLDTFVVERKHRSFKRIIDNIQTDGGSLTFEQSVLARALSSQFQSLQNTGEYDKVELVRVRSVKPAECPSLALALNASRVEVAEGIDFRGLSIRVNNVLKIGNQCGIVVSCLSADASPTLLLQLYSFHNKTRSSTTWNKTGVVASFDLKEDFELIQIWTIDQMTSRLTTLV